MSSTNREEEREAQRKLESCRSQKSRSRSRSRSRSSHKNPPSQSNENDEKIEEIDKNKKNEQKQKNNENNEQLQLNQNQNQNQNKSQPFHSIPPLENNDNNNKLDGTELKQPPPNQNKLEIDTDDENENDLQINLVQKISNYLITNNYTLNNYIETLYDGIAEKMIESKKMALLNDTNSNKRNEKILKYVYEENTNYLLALEKDKKKNKKKKNKKNKSNNNNNNNKNEQKDEPKEWEVDKIIRHYGDGDAIWFRVKWKSFQHSSNSWESYDNLIGNSQFTDYLLQLKKLNMF